MNRRRILGMPMPTAVVVLATMACSGSNGGPGEAATDGADATRGGGPQTVASGPDGTGASDGPSATSLDASSTAEGGGSDELQFAYEFLARWPGLWMGPVDSSTSAGDFATMSMDARPVAGHTLFSRADLDGSNDVRFAFVIEEHDGRAQLVFRNGGQFLGVRRDNRTVLHEADGTMYRFCALQGGCDYIDARFTFEGVDRMSLHTEVRGQPHFDWPATRAEVRQLDGPFPADDAVPQPGDAQLPAMPSLQAGLTWTTPVESPTDVWVILSTTACFPGGGCTGSRWIRTTAEVGATSATVMIEQLHPGSYRANAALDRNGNWTATLFPDRGDTVAVPDTTVTVAPEGVTDAALALTVNL